MQRFDDSCLVKAMRGVSLLEMVTYSGGWGFGIRPSVCQIVLAAFRQIPDRAAAM